MADATAPTETTIRATLRHDAFRALLAGGSLYFVGNAMQVMAASWLMIERTGSSFLAALVQTAVFLPMVLLALPGGVLADTTDRRRLLLGALWLQSAAVVLLAVLVLAGWAGAATLLVLTFGMGCCTALMSPSWNSAIVDVVPRAELPQAITAVGISYNAARALGPAAAGFLYALAGGGWVFALALLGVLAMIESVRRHPPRPHPPSRLPAERLWGGMVSALRFARHSETVLAQLVRTGAYGGAGSALWALLPVLAQQQLGLGAAGYGTLIGCLGAGAVTAGLGVAALRRRLGLERLCVAGCVTYAAVMAVCAHVRSAPLVYALLLVAGGCWMSVMSTFNTATQTSVPPWVRARATALHTLCALGSFALGSAFWGALSDLVGLRTALTLGALAMAAGLLLVRRFPLRQGEVGEVTQVKTADNLFIVHEPDPEAGPVAVEIAYRVRPEQVDAFLDEVTQLRAPRRRDGATLWRVYRDLSDPSRFVERFIVTSWADYLHQRARATLADQAVEERLLAHLVAGDLPRIDHYVAER
ncbi:MAG: MFS transporter [Rubrivivax sp.]